MTDFLPSLAILGIGSVPFRPHQNSCEIIFRQWDLPFWPQYPSRSFSEHFVFQFLTSLPGLEITPSGACLNAAQYLREEKACEEKLNEAFAKRSFLPFEPPPESALGYSQLKELLSQGVFPEKRWIKLQITGPGTVWNSFFAERVLKGKAGRIRRLVFRTLLARGLAQIERIRRHRRNALVFIDEPLFSEDPSEISEMIDSFHPFGALVGLHTCSRSNWEVLRSLPIDLFHFDLHAHPELSPEKIKFLQNLVEKKRGIAWGVVPTEPDPAFKAQDFSRYLLDRIKEIFLRRFSPEKVLEHSFIAPACGTGTLPPEQDEAVFQSVRMTRESLKR